MKKLKAKSFIQKHLLRITAITVTLSMVLNMIPFAQLPFFSEIMAAGPVDNQILVEGPSGTTAYTSDEEGFLEAILNAEDGSTIDILGDIYITAMVRIDKSLTLKSSNGSSIIRKQAFQSDSSMFKFRGDATTIILKDIIIDGNNVPSQGCALEINPGAGPVANHVIIEDGTVIKNNNSYTAGGIYNDGILTINGGEISNNVANGSAGGIWNNGVLTMNGGRIIGNSADNSGQGQGGGIYSGGHLTITGGTISGNYAGSQGGGVYSFDNFYGHTFNISGNATITDNSRRKEVFEYRYSISDNVCVDGMVLNVSDTFTGSVGLNLYYSREHRLTTGTAVTGVLTPESKDNFFIDRLVETDYATKVKTFYDTVFNYDTNTIDIVEITDKVKEVSADGDLQTAINAVTYDEYGYLNVTADQTVDNEITVSDGRALTIFSTNGSKLLKNANTNVIKSTGADTKLTLRDIIIDGNRAGLATNAFPAVTNEASAKLIINPGTVIENNEINSGTDPESGSVKNKSDMLMNSGTIRNNLSTTQYSVGAICNNISSSFTMNGGTICNNESNTGGGVFNNGAYIMNSGTFSDNTATEGGGVYNSSGTFTMNEGIIRNNTATEGGGVYNYTTFNMNNGVISHNNGNGVYNRNVFNMSNGIIGNNTGVNGGGVYNQGSFTMSDGAICHNTATGYGDGVFNAFDLIMNGGTFTMKNGTISHNNGIGVYNSDGTFIMESGTIFLNNDNGVYNYAGTFNMENGTISHNNGAGVHNYDDGTFNMENGIISKNNGNGVFNSGDIFNMKNGTISNNNGAGIYNSGNSVHMENGTISHNNEGGVYNSGLNIMFFMGNGTISHNKGTGVHNSNGGLFHMDNGTISNNISTGPGGGVFNGDTSDSDPMNRSNFHMMGGTICNNTAAIGGGVYNLSLFDMSDGTTISNNTATEKDGGGVYNDGLFYMLNAAVLNNTGDGVYSNNEFSIDGSTISGNTRGVYNNGTLTMSNSTISDNNTTGSSGGGVYNNGTFNMSNSTISNNTTTGDGGGVYNNNTFNMNGGNISSNTASSGGGVYNSSTFVAVNSSFIGNTNDAIRTSTTLEQNTAYLFHCTAADNTGTGVFVDNTDIKPYIYNSIITGNSVQAINSQLMSTGKNIIDDGDEINRDAIFGDMETTDGYISVAIGGPADKTAHMLDKSDITETGLKDEILTDIIGKLNVDQRGWNRPADDGADGKVDYGSVESLVGVIIDAEILSNPTKTSDQYHCGDELDLSGGSIKVTYSDGTSKTVSMSSPEVTVSGYSPTTIGVEQTVVLTYNTFEFRLYITVSKCAPSLYLTAEMKTGRSKNVVLTANLYDWYYNAEIEQAVEFYVDGTFLGEAVPDDKGKATLNYQIPLFGEYEFSAKLIENEVSNECQSSPVSYEAVGKNQVELQLSSRASELTYGVEFDLDNLVFGGSGTGAFIYTIDEDCGTVVNNKFTPAKIGVIDITVTKPEDIDHKEISRTFSVNVNRKQLTIINAEVNDKAYDGNNTATFKNTPSLRGVIGTDTITLTNGTPTFKTVNAGNNIEIVFTPEFSIDGINFLNYTLIQPTGITANITNGFTPENGTHYTTTSLNAEGWTNGDFVISAKDGYKISTDNKANSVWSNQLTYSVNTANGTVIFYLMDTATGAISPAKTEGYKIDKTIPTPEVKYQENGFKSFLNTITFGLFFKDKVDVQIQGLDALSGVAKVEYFRSETEITNFDNLQWINGNTFSALENEKFILYTRITDKADNTMICYDGIVVYTDSQATANGEFIKNSDDNLIVNVSMNGNAVKEIKNGADVLIEGTHYTLGADSVSFKNTYLKGLNEGKYDFTISYYPLGETGVAQGDSELPNATLISMSISKAPQTGFKITGPDAKTYGDGGFTLNATGGQTNGVVTFTVPNEDVVSITEDGQVRINNAGTVIVTAVKQGNDIYKNATAKYILTVNKKPVTITVENKIKHFGEADPELTWTVTGLLDNDNITGSLTHSGSDVGTYDIIQDEEFTNDNYDISFVKGTMSITFTPSMDNTIVIVDDLPNEAVSPNDADKIADIINEYDKLSDEEKEQLPADIIEKLETAKVSAGKINHTDNDNGIVISGDDLSWNIRLVASEKPPAQSDYLDFSDRLPDEKLLALYDLKLTDTLTGESYNPQAGESITISLDKVNLKDVKEIQIVHEKKDGTIEHLPATIKDGKIIFTATSFSFYGVTAASNTVTDKGTDTAPNNDTNPPTGINLDMLSWLGIAFVATLPCYLIIIRIISKKNRAK